MTLNTTGPISLGGSTLGQSIALELGQLATATISLNDTNVRALAGRITAGSSVTMPTDFYGKPTSVSARYVVCGGGGGNSASGNGQGGAGGYLAGTTTLTLSQTYTIVVGALSGGDNQFPDFDPPNGNNGSNTTAFGLTAIGGGGGGGGGGTSSSDPPGSSGGSGGGGSYDDATHPGGAGTPGQGFAGGSGTCQAGSFCAAGGGGGAGGAAPAASSGNRGSAAGPGVANDITGTSINYATGGGGPPHQNTPGSGATNNGIVIVRYVGRQQFNGGTVTRVGTDTVHTFNTSGTLVRI